MLDTFNLIPLTSCLQNQGWLGHYSPGCLSPMLSTKKGQIMLPLLSPLFTPTRQDCPTGAKSSWGVRQLKILRSSDAQSPCTNLVLLNLI